MCGIAGFLAPQGERADRAVLERMVAALRHRGPDSVGHYVQGRAALGAARLRVVDLHTGDQPVSNEAGDVTVVLNGEIYDHARYRDALLERGHHFRTRSDTEVIAHGWEQDRERVLEHLNGMFAFAVWDQSEEILFLARDRMGEKPLYFAATNGWVVFASELNAMLVHPAVSRCLDATSVARYLTYDYVPDPHSIISGVTKLPPAHSLIVRGGETTRRRYWEIPFEPDGGIDERTWCSEIATRFDRAVAMRLQGDVPVGCFLSGGIDSTAVTGTAARHRADLRTFSVGYDGYPQDERRFARIAANQFATHHEELVVSAHDIIPVVRRLGQLLDEPLSDMSFVPLYMLSCAAKRSITVALTGDGGDELFGGYPSMAADRWHSRFARLPRSILAGLRVAATVAPGHTGPFLEFLDAIGYGPGARNQALLGGFPPHRLDPLLSEPLRACLRECDPYADIRTVLRASPAADPIDRLIYRYCKHYLAGQNLVNSDRASMATGLELRAPFLDHTFVEFLGRIPGRMKLTGFRHPKRLLKRALADRLPTTIVRRPKQGFGVPFDRWFRGPLAALLREILAPERLTRAGIFNGDAVARLVNEHLSGSHNHDDALWSLLVFELWKSEHLGDGPPAMTAEH